MWLSIILLIVICLVSLLLFISKYLSRNFSYWEKKGIPYLQPKIGFGNVKDVLLLKNSLGRHLANLYHIANREPFFGIFIIDEPALVIRDLEVIQLILVKDFKYFHDRVVSSDYVNDPVTANMLYYCKNPEWKMERKKLSQIFDEENFEQIFPKLMLRSCNYMSKLLETLDVTKNININELCEKLSIDIISLYVFGNNFKTEPEEFRKYCKLFFDHKFSTVLQQVVGFYRPELVKFWKMKITPILLSNFMKNVCKKNIEHRRNSRIDEDDRDYFDYIMEIYNENNNSGDKITACILQFFLGSFATVSSTVAFLLYELCLHKNLQDEIRNEIKSAKKKYGFWTYENMENLVFLKMCLNETLRKYPVLPFVERRCTKNYKIPGFDIVIEKDVPVYIPILGLQNDPQHFKEPDVFNPQRFSEENLKKTESGSYLPFGWGPRNCIGKTFGIMASKMEIVHILENYEILKCEETPTHIDFEAKSIILASKFPLYVKLKKL